MSDSKLAKLLTGLNPEQEEAVLTLTGPVRILAGAGAGKTLTLTRRLAYGVVSGRYEPAQTLALSFSRLAALQLSERLRALGVAGVTVGTIHQIAYSQLRYFCEQIHGHAAGKLISNKPRFFEEVAQGLGLKELGRQTKLITELEWCKQRGVSPGQYAQLVPPRPLTQLYDPQEIVRLFVAYEQAKLDRRLIDFEDVLLLTIALLDQQSSVRARLSDRYRVFLVDEYQDTSPLQNELLRLWFGQSRDVCVVGDPNQSVYGFAGARPDFLLQFSSAFENCRQIELRRNYRCRPAIVDLANRVFADKTPAIIAQLPANPDLLALEWHGFLNEYHELKFLVDSLRKLKEAGQDLGDVAVLYRTSRLGRRLAERLDRAGIDYRLKGQETRNLFDLERVRQAVQLLLQLAYVHKSDSPAPEPIRLVEEVLVQMHWEQQRPLDPRRREEWTALYGLRALAGRYEGRLEDFRLSLFRLGDLRLDFPLPWPTLATIHAAKGLEWSRVFLIGLNEDILPHQDGDLAEERRLFYVGITRAKESLCFTDSGNRPSSFLTELGGSIERIEHDPDP